MIAMWQVFARLWNIQARIDAAERKKLIESGIRIGVAHATGKPVHESYRGYGRMIAEQAEHAYARLIAPQPAQEPPSAVYAPPDKHTDSMRPLASPEQLRAFLNTQSLPAVPKPGDVARSWRKKHGTAQE